jgi:hypothetical protein
VETGCFCVVRVQMLEARGKVTDESVDSWVQLWDGGQPRMASARETKEYSQLEAVAREWLVKTSCWKTLSGTALICELWSLAMAMKFLVVPSRVHKWSINPFTNSNPVCSHTYTTWQQYLWNHFCACCIMLIKLACHSQEGLIFSNGWELIWSKIYVTKRCRILFYLS